MPERKYPNEEVWAAYDRLCSVAKTAKELGVTPGVVYRALDARPGRQRRSNGNKALGSVSLPSLKCLED